MDLERLETERILKNILNELSDEFIDGLKTENYKNALCNIENIEKISEDDFQTLVIERAKTLDEFELSELEHIIIKTKNENQIDEKFSIREKVLLLIQSMVNSHETSKHHQEELSKIYISQECYEKNTEGFMALSPVEIRLLSKLQNKTVKSPNLPGYFTYEYALNYQTAIRKLLNMGYLLVGDLEYNLSRQTIPELKKILLTNGYKVGGNKAELVKRIVDNASEIEIENLKIQEYFILTDSGTQLLKLNEALLLFYNAFSQCGWTTPEEVVEEQQKNPNFNGNNILIYILKQKIEQAVIGSSKYPLLRNLQTLYEWEKDENALKDIKVQLSQLDKEFAMQLEERSKSRM